MARKRIVVVFDASPLLVNKTGVAYYIERLVTSLARQYPDELELVGFYYNFLGRRSTTHLPKAPNLHFHAVRFLPSKIIYQLRRWGIEFPVEYLSGTQANFVLYTNFLSYPSLFKTPSAPVIHDLAYIDLPETVAEKNRRDLTRFVPKAIERSAFVITVSEFTKSKLQKLYKLPADKILVTPIPPDEPRELSAKKQKSLLAAAGVNKSYLLFVGTVEPRKNLVNLIEAYRQLPQELRDEYSMVIAGRIGWNCQAEEAALAEAVADGFDVRHLGYVDEDTRTALFKNATLFVSASNYEGYGMPVIEAMAAGVPVAISDIPVFREVAQENAFYFDQTKPTTIAAIIQEALLDDKRRTRLSIAGLNRVAQFDWDRVTTNIHDKIIETLHSN